MRNTKQKPSLICQEYNEVVDLSKRLNVSAKCAQDVIYLRSRSIWNKSVENDLINRYKSGKTVNIFQFCAEKTNEHNG